MIFDEFRTYLNGYTEYLAIDTGIEFKLRRNKRLKIYEILIRLKNNEDSHFLKLLSFYYGDLKNSCRINIKVGNKTLIDFFVNELENSDIKIIFNRDPEDMYDVLVEINCIEELRKLFNVLESVNYFEYWGIRVDN